MPENEISREIRAEKNFRLGTVGFVGTFLATANGGMSLWLTVTGDKLVGAIFAVSAAAMLFVAQNAFGRIRPHRPTLGGNNGQKEKAD